MSFFFHASPATNLPLAPTGSRGTERFTVCRVTDVVASPPPIHLLSRLQLQPTAFSQETVSVWVPGLMIIAARVSKPTIPQQLQGDFVHVEEEISKLKVGRHKN